MNNDTKLMTAPCLIHTANVFLPGCLGPVRREVVLADDHHELIARLLAEADEARAEIARLRIENASLRKDKDRIDTLEGNCWDVRYTASPTPGGDDSSISIEIVSHWTAPPHERVLGENSNEDLRAAIDQAALAEGDNNPPARPEYPVPDFGGGGGNKARRRAAALGIDMDAAMRERVNFDLDRMKQALASPRHVLPAGLSRGQIREHICLVAQSISASPPVPFTDRVCFDPTCFLCDGTGWWAGSKCYGEDIPF